MYPDSRRKLSYHAGEQRRWKRVKGWEGREKKNGVEDKRGKQVGEATQKVICSMLGRTGEHHVEARPGYVHRWRKRRKQRGVKGSRKIATETESGGRRWKRERKRWRNVLRARGPGEKKKIGDCFRAEKRRMQNGFIGRSNKKPLPRSLSSSCSSV